VKRRVQQIEIFIGDKLAGVISPEGWIALWEDSGVKYAFLSRVSGFALFLEEDEGKIRLRFVRRKNRRKARRSVGSQN